MRNATRCLRNLLVVLATTAPLALPPVLAQVPANVASQQAISPPRGLAESDVAVQNGAFASKISLDLPEFRSLTPELVLRYNSSAPNDFAGVGWSLTGFSTIERASPGRGSPRFSQTLGAESYLLDGQELIPSTALGGTHATLRQNHQRIKQSSDGANWQIIRTDGTVLTYLPVFTSSTGTFRWGISTIRDTHGNQVNYEWTCDPVGGNRGCYPSKISYANTVVTLARELRPDAIGYATGAWLADERYRLKSVSVVTNGTPRNSYQLTYATSTRTGRSLLIKVQQFGKDGVTALPPVGMSYTDTPTGFAAATDIANSYGLGAVSWQNVAVHHHDFNGDGRKDVFIHGSLQPARLMLANTTGGFNNVSDISALYGMTLAKWQMSVPLFGDFNGDGRTDILVRWYPTWVTTQPKPWRTYLLLANSSNGFNNAVDITSSYGLSITQWEFAPLVVGDYNGDGKQDLLIQYKTSLANQSKAYVLFGSSTGFSGTALDITAQSGMSSTLWRDWKVVPADFNGDGMTDLLLAADSATTGADRRIMLARKHPTIPFETAETVSDMYGVSDDAWADATLAAGDFNGDGRTDLLLQHKNASTANYPTGILYSLGGDRPGRMFSTIVDITNAHGMTEDRWRYAVLTIADFNGDGRSDIVARRTQLNLDSTYLLASHSAGFADAVQIGGLYGVAQSDWTKDEIYAADFDGDGDEELFLKPTAVQSSYRTYVISANGRSTNLVASQSNGYGAINSIQYEPSSTWTNQNNPPITQAVASYITTDTTGWSSSTFFEYAGGLWDPVERRHLGFRYVQTVDPTDAYTEEYFYQGPQYGLGDRESQYRKDAAGLLQSQSLQSFTISAAAPWTKTGRVQTDSEFNGDTSFRVSKVTETYDVYGNQVSLIQHGDDAVTGDERLTVSTFYPNSAAYIVQYPGSRKTHKGTTTAGALVAETIHFFDGSTSATVPPVRGDVTRRDQRKASAGGYASTLYAYDTYGNVIAQTDPRGNVATTVWNTPFGLFPSSQKDALLHETVNVWDFTCGEQISTTDPNGAVESWTYDTLCRTIRHTQPDGGYTKWTYQNLGTSTQSIREEQRDGTADDLWKVNYFDGLGRTYKTVSEGDRTILTTFDARGDVATVSAPFSAAETPRLTSYSYDALRRPTSILHADGSMLRTLYGDWSSTTCDELGKPQSKYLDAYANVVEVREYLGKTCVLSPTGTVGVDLLKTAITYDEAGRQLSVTDALGNVSSASYDFLGNKLQVVDLDRGTWIYTYDDNGNLQTSKDPIGMTFRYTYDALDRLIEKRKIGGLESVVAAYFYDEADHGATVGRLSRVTFPRGNVWYNYDISGNVVDEYRQIDLMVTGFATLGAPPPGSYNLYHVGRSYDYLGRIASITYPDGEVLSHTYDAAGRLYSVGAYVAAATYDARDNLTSRTLGNGVVETFSYHPHRFWLARSTASKAGTLHDVAYGRNLRGEVTSRLNSVVATDAWTFGYDDLRRMNAATATGNSAWNQSFAYDALGRITSQTGTGTYTYFAAGAGPLHGPASVNGVPVTYDANGQMSSGFGVSLIAYDWQGRITYADDVSYSYDHAGAMVSSSVARFMPGLFEEDKTSGVTMNYINFDDARIARKRAGAVSYYHGDQVGSVSAITDSSGAVVQRNVFSPYGKRLWQSGTLADNPFGLAAQRMEPSGLYSMGARMMSPLAGMFTAPDPSDAPDPLQPQSLNRFSYTRNSPVNLVDPTGFADEGAANGESRWQRMYHGLQRLVFPNLDQLRARGEAGTWTTNLKGAGKAWVNWYLDFSAITQPGVFKDVPRFEIANNELEGAALFDVGSGVIGAFGGGGSSAGRVASTTTPRVTRIMPSLTRGWRLGDPINNLTAAGRIPSWSAIRARFWKNEGLLNAAEYSEANLARMKQGLAPQRTNPVTGKVESMELHHDPPQRDGGLFDVERLWPEEHAEVDPFRHVGQ